MFKKLNDTVLRKTYIFSLGIILVLIVLNIGFISSLKIHDISTSKEIELIDDVRYVKGNIVVNLKSVDMSVRGFLLTANPIFKDSYKYHFNSQLRDFKIMDSLFVVIKHKSTHYAATKSGLIGYYELMGEVLEMKENDKLDDAIEIINQDRGTEVWNKYLKFAEELDNHINGIEGEILSTKDALIITNVTLEILLGIFGIPIIILIIYLIISTDKEKKLLFEELKEKNNSLLFYEEDPENKLKDSTAIITKLMNNIVKASQFVEKLISGDYSIDWEGTKNKNEQNKRTLAGRLVELKETLYEVDNERKKRKWFNEGVNNLSEIVRKYQEDRELFYDKALQFSIKYLNALQGGLFIYDSESESLRLKAAYAYDRQKFLEKEIKVGEGIVGQAFLEKEPTHLRRISNKFTYIQSGLGESKPIDVYVLPLINNEEVIGIMELASFNHFSDREVEFLGKLAEIVASSLYVQLNNEKTELLLHKSQEQGEELRAQEEEMRQNTEELQTTQEEMERQKLTLEEEVNALKKELQQYKEVAG